MYQVLNYCNAIEFQDLLMYEKRSKLLNLAYGAHRDMPFLVLYLHPIISRFVL